MFKVSKYGDDVLQTACIKGALLVFNYLIDKIDYNLPQVLKIDKCSGRSEMKVLLLRQETTINDNGEGTRPKT